MPTSIVIQRPGQINLTGAVDASFLLQFSGEILAEFRNMTVFKDRHITRTITNGRSAQFPMIGAASASYHAPGTWLEAGQIGMSQKIVTVDPAMIAANSIPEIEELQNHFEVRGPIAKELAEALALAFDRNVARVKVLAARATNPLTGRAGGTRITNANIGTDADILAAALFTAAETLDVKNVAKDGRNAFFRPKEFYMLVQNARVTDKTLGGDGSRTMGEVDSYAGLKIVKTNSLPSANDSANTALQTRYRADYSAVRGLVTHPYAAATTQLQGLTTATEWEERYQATLLTAKMVVGHDWLRPECAVELATA